MTTLSRKTARRRTARRALAALALISLALSVAALRPLSAQEPVSTPSATSAADTTAATSSPVEPGTHAIFAEANRRFEKPESVEDLEAAARGYERLIASGLRSAALYYNLGNTHLRLGDLGKSILNFRRALLYDPSDAYARAMLEEARSQIRGQLPDLYASSTEESLLKHLFFWHFRLSFGERLAALCAAWLLFWGLLAVRLRARLPMHRFAIAASGIVAVALATSLAFEGLSERGAEAVVVAPETDVRAGNGASFELVLDRPVLSGAEVRVLETRNLWHLVKFPAGTVGWVPASAVEMVDPERR